MDYKTRSELRREYLTPAEAEERVFDLRNQIDDLVDELTSALCAFNDAVRDHAALATRS